MTISLNQIGWLFFLQKKNGNAQIFIPDGSLIGSGIVMGRDRSCDLVIEDQYISRKHCRVRYYKGNLQIYDMGSTNSIFLDGMQIPKGKHSIWLPNSSLRIGVGIEITAKRINLKELPKNAILINKQIAKLEVQEPTDSTVMLVSMSNESYPIPSALPKNKQQTFLFKYMDKIIISLIAILAFGTLLYIVFVQFIKHQL